MKLTFTFTSSPNLSALTSADIYYTHFELPDTALQLSDCKERILGIGELVGQLTCASLHFTCRELELKNKLVVSNDITGKNLGQIGAFGTFGHMITLGFKRSGHNLPNRKDLRIRLPIKSPSFHNWQGTRYPISSNYVSKTEEEQKYIGKIRAIAEHCLALLNSENGSEVSEWEFKEFYPLKHDTATFTRWKKQRKKEAVETRRREKQAKKQQELKITNSEKEQNDQLIPKTGAGRRVGAVPGIFKGVQFRSQLEIRFVTQLEAKQIRWVYEGERLGDGNYLVDFYLPDLGCWVEVKGRLEPRDDYLLKDVASFLKKERNERLFVYTQSKAFRVNINQFKQLTHDEFWIKLVQ